MCSIVSQDVFDYLIKHMLDIHEQKMSIVSSYSIEYDEYMKMLFTIKGYIKKIENFLESATISKCSNHIPFVIFGCNIHLSSESTNENMVCRIVLTNDSKFDEKEDNGVIIIKCCAPAADSLLFKKIGDKVKLNGYNENSYWVIKNLQLNIKSEYDDINIGCN